MSALYREWRIFLLEWARREINPLHPDLPGIVRELSYRYDCRPKGQV